MGIRSSRWLPSGPRSYSNTATPPPRPSAEPVTVQRVASNTGVNHLVGLDIRRLGNAFAAMTGMNPAPVVVETVTKVLVYLIHSTRSITTCRSVSSTR